MSTDHCQGIGGTIRTRKAMPLQPTPITGVAMFSCVQLMSGYGMTVRGRAASDVDDSQLSQRRILETAYDCGNAPLRFRQKVSASCVVWSLLTVAHDREEFVRTAWRRLRHRGGG